MKTLLRVLKSEGDASYSLRDADGVLIARDMYEDDATHIVRCVNAHAGLVEALKEISKGEGRYSRDPHIHADNTIEDMKALAVTALAEVDHD